MTRMDMLGRSYLFGGYLYVQSIFGLACWKGMGWEQGVPHSFALVRALG